MSAAPFWILRSVVEAAHDELIAEFGGASGVRDLGSLESALARPENLYAYAASDIFALSAAYAFGIVKNHPFVDGNKRTAFLAAHLFLRINGWRLVAAQADATEAMFSLAAGTLAESTFADWLRSNARAA